MPNTLEKLIAKWIPDDIQDKVQDRMQEQRKEAAARLRAKRKEAQAEIRAKRKEAKARLQEKRRAAHGGRSSTGKSLVGALLGALAGSVLMYFLDPRGGARRRALLRDQIVHLRHQGQDMIEGAGGTASRVKDRARGTMIETQGRIQERLSDEPVPDQQLEARVRSEMGRFVKHLSAIDIRAREGVVTLSGAVLADEVEAVVKAARNVRGVKSIENKLTVYERPEDIPALQG